MELSWLGLATQCTLDKIVVIIPASPQLQKARFEMGGIGNSSSSEEYFYRSFGLRLVFRFETLRVLAQRAASSQELFTEVLRLAQAYVPGRCRASAPESRLRRGERA